MACILKISPLAVGRPSKGWPYQEAIPSWPWIIAVGGCFWVVDGGRPGWEGAGGGDGGVTTVGRRWQAVQKNARPARNRRRANFLSVPKRVLGFSVLTTISGFARFFVKTSAFCSFVLPSDFPVRPGQSYSPPSGVGLFYRRFDGSATPGPENGAKLRTRTAGENGLSSWGWGGI